MAIPWLAVLKIVPWNDVIRNAPQLAETARKLWDASKSGKSGKAPPARSPSFKPGPMVSARLSPPRVVPNKLRGFGCLPAWPRRRRRPAD